ncbi:orotidine-5'-phosphate decarboxylase [Spiroplasma eriocheiris]|uniref:Orotidine 5'-phosphate decarboxylase n=1 Tax=Spiroplasma eriocheiris TaxID=315358 RepID=A0A0H3XM89_9MOLU|nr:orotidine-5'-phosphate decarboxylase [Spiroplasma eriocheiris]AHF57550.1 hypothetical protein SPE_0421 [Spiroplasma eriocheiris CCTCC M 207170]AKM54007.1 orotidine-5'-phosphate decarboxylase [Spiroplasma eriocheiris]
MKNNIIIACDFNNKQELTTFLNNFKSEKLFLKLGMELIYSEGLEIINELKQQGHQIFLDLKLHDIPVTVKKALQSLSQYQIDMLTIHLASGKEALQLTSILAKQHNIKLLGVTVLTSLDNSDLQEMFLSDTLTSEALVLNFAKLAVDANYYGVICSPLEAQQIKAQYPQLKTITPGIQLSTTQTDQKRVASPAIAREYQADYLVVGRAITTASDPYQTYHQIYEEFNQERKIK